MPSRQSLGLTEHRKAVRTNAARRMKMDAAAPWAFIIESPRPLEAQRCCLKNELVQRARSVEVVEDIRFQADGVQISLVRDRKNIVADISRSALGRRCIMGREFLARTQNTDNAVCRLLNVRVRRRKADAVGCCK